MFFSSIIKEVRVWLKSRHFFHFKAMMTRLYEFDKLWLKTETRWSCSNSSCMMIQNDFFRNRSSSIFWSKKFSVFFINERRNWNSMKITSLHELTFNENHNQCKNWNSMKIAFTNAMNMIVIEWKCWKVRWQKTEIWARIESEFLIDRLNEACQNRSLLETSAQPNCTYFCT